MVRVHKRAMLIIALTLAVAGSIATSSAQAADYLYDPDLRWWAHNSLESVTSSQGGQTKRVPKAIYVRCYHNRAAFEQGLIRRGALRADVHYVIAYYAGGPTINMRAGTCDLAHEFVEGHVTQDTAGAFKTMLHEALHRQGIKNERTTESLAIAAMYDAGQLVDYNQRLLYDAPEDTATWDAAASAGARAARLAWQQSRRYIADEYLVSWPRIGWYYNNLSWADVLDSGLQGI